jgi:hypothetical protein
MGDALDEHTAVACNLETQQGRCLVKPNQVDPATRSPAQGDLERYARMVALFEENADIEVTVRALGVPPRRPEEHGKANPRCRFQGLTQRLLRIHSIADSNTALPDRGAISMILDACRPGFSRAV